MNTVPMLEADIARWRAALARSRAIVPSDADELESHLREQVTDLRAVGLDDQEAFLVAVGRLGRMHAITAEFAREHGDRIWKQLAPIVDDAAGRRRPLLLMLGFAVLSALLIQAVRLLAGGTEPAPWYYRNLGLVLLLPLAVWFVLIRAVPPRRTVALAAVVAMLAVAVSTFPFRADSATGALAAAGLAVVIWFVVGVTYLGGDARPLARRMEFVRFSGEWAIYFILLALGGGVLLALGGLVLAPIVPEAPEALSIWVIPSGAAGGVVVAAWLVEAKKSVVENLAPVLTAIFTPLFALLLLAAVVLYAVAGIGRDFDRDLLTVFDTLLLVVLGLVLYGLSARDPMRRAGLSDALRAGAVVAALLLDVLVLASMLARVAQFGFTANRTAALGLNLLLVVDLAGTAVLSARLLAGRTDAARLERWQTAYLPAFGVWAVLVVLVLPPVFGFA
ncbi:permease prefix domain 1-containing protein [uncultured Amnibacterium sp.]|uniref:permease prefix domain 1-containing protein n=1 Tax=uncultured Amnibacterium sp. TaxID=1631851 RepID=UPI0035CC5C3E